MDSAAARSLVNRDESVIRFDGFWPSIDMGDLGHFPTYFLIISLTFCICLLWAVRRVDKRGLSRIEFLDLAMIAMLSGFVGSRLLHVVIEEPSYYLENPWMIAAVWRGGFTWYGGLVCGACSAWGWAWARGRKINIKIWLDLLAPVIALGYGLGRTACLLVGCCYGGVCTLESGVQFRYPTQAIAVIWELGSLIVLLYFERRHRTGNGLNHWRRPGQLFALWLLLHSTGRIMMEMMRADPRGPAMLGFHLSAWISFVLMAGSLIHILRSPIAKER